MNKEQKRRERSKKKQKKKRIEIEQRKIKGGIEKQQYKKENVLFVKILSTLPIIAEIREM